MIMMHSRVEAIQDVTIEMITFFRTENNDDRIIMAQGSQGLVVQENDWPLIEIDSTGSRYYIPIEYLKEVE